MAKTWPKPARTTTRKKMARAARTGPSINPWAGARWNLLLSSVGFRTQGSSQKAHVNLVATFATRMLAALARHLRIDNLIG
jgi:hypothetical protein